MNRRSSPHYCRAKHFQTFLFDQWDGQGFTNICPYSAFVLPVLQQSFKCYNYCRSVGMLHVSLELMTGSQSFQTSNQLNIASSAWKSGGGSVLLKMTRFGDLVQLNSTLFNWRRTKADYNHVSKRWIRSVDLWGFYELNSGMCLQQSVFMVPTNMTEK